MDSAQQALLVVVMLFVVAGIAIAMFLGWTGKPRREEEARQVSESEQFRAAQRRQEAERRTAAQRGRDAERQIQAMLTGQPAMVATTARTGVQQNSTSISDDSHVAERENQNRDAAHGGGVVAIAVGSRHGLALKGDGSVVAWGEAYGMPPGLAGATAIAAGRNHSLALKRDGTVVAWGQNGKGQTDVPVGLTGVTAIAAGVAHSLALKEDGTVVAWGFNDAGQADVPAGLTGVKAIAAGWWHSLALKNDGSVVAWGHPDSDQRHV